jgi:hypothetical protein
VSSIVDGSIEVLKMTGGCWSGEAEVSFDVVGGIDRSGIGFHITGAQ